MRRHFAARGLNGIDPRLFDVALAVLFCAVGQVDVWLGFADGDGGVVPTDDRLLVALLSLVATSMLAVRRSAPLAGLATMVAAGLVQVYLVTPVAFFFGQFIPIVLMTYAVAAHAERPRPASAGLALAILGVTAITTAVPSLRSWDNHLFQSVVLLLVWSVGYILGGRLQRAEALARRAAELEQERNRAISEERARLARELHDIVAHSVSMIAVQAEAGETLLEDDPERAAAAFRSIQAASRQSLTELRRLLGLLREADSPAALAPQPGLAEIGRLVEGVRAAGLTVELTIVGEPSALDPGVDLSAYRVVQEALTNALRHAGPARARVRISYLPGALEVEVADDGHGGGEPAGAGADGQGLVGMRERVALYGGEFLAGRRSEGGFAVRARLPLGGA